MAAIYPPLDTVTQMNCNLNPIPFAHFEYGSKLSFNIHASSLVRNTTGLQCVIWNRRCSVLWMDILNIRLVIHIMIVGPSQGLEEDTPL